MKPMQLVAFAATSVGFITAAIALVHTTSLTMTAFFFLGITGFFVGFVLYVYAVLRELRAKRVL
jgi:hypothetical protein